MNKELENRINEIVDSHIQEMFLSSQDAAGIDHGDISPEHDIRLDYIREELKYIIKETIKRNES